MAEGENDSESGRDYYKGDRGKKPLRNPLSRLLAQTYFDLGDRINLKARVDILVDLFNKYGGEKGKDKVLDVGAGRFLLKESLSRHNIKAVGIDLNSQGFVLQAKKRQIAPNRMEAVQGNATRLPFPNDSFLLASCSDMMEHLRTDEEALSVLDELGRVAKKVIFVQITPTDDFMGGRFFKYDRTHHLGKTTLEWEGFISGWASQKGWSLADSIWTKKNPRLPPQSPAWILVKNTP